LENTQLEIVPLEAATAAARKGPRAGRWHNRAEKFRDASHACWGAERLASERRSRS
jgi:hypothetical protein